MIIRTLLSWFPTHQRLVPINSQLLAGIRSVRAPFTCLWTSFTWIVGKLCIWCPGMTECFCSLSPYDVNYQRTHSFGCWPFNLTACSLNFQIWLWIYLFLCFTQMAVSIIYQGKFPGKAWHEKHTSISVGLHNESSMGLGHFSPPL